jgi:xanthine dehydrogenase accessory factor
LSAQWDWLRKASELDAAGVPFALVTVVDVKGSAPRAAGAKLIVTGSGDWYGTVGGGQLERLILADARKALDEAVSAPRRYPLCLRTGQCCGGAVDIFIEIMGVGPLLYVFGAGHVGQALCSTLAGTPFTLHVVDERSEWREHAALPVGVRRHGEGWRAFMASATWDAQRVYAAVMTHDHQEDLEIVQALVEKPARFIGLIGSATKWERFQQRLAGLGVPTERIARIHCPIGRPTGGKAPREVAISVAADLLERHYTKDS